MVRYTAISLTIKCGPAPALERCCACQGVCRGWSRLQDVVSLHFDMLAACTKCCGKHESCMLPLQSYFCSNSRHHMAEITVCTRMRVASRLWCASRHVVSVMSTPLCSLMACSGASGSSPSVDHQTYAGLAGRCRMDDAQSSHLGVLRQAEHTFCIAHSSHTHLNPPWQSRLDPSPAARSASRLAALCLALPVAPAQCG